LRRLRRVNGCWCWLLTIKWVIISGLISYLFDDIPHIITYLLPIVAVRGISESEISNQVCHSVINGASIVENIITQLVQISDSVKVVN